MQVRTQQRWYRILQHSAGPLICRILGVQDRRFGTLPAGPFLLLCNHNMNLDPVLIGCHIREPLSFVASGHVFKKTFASRLMVDLFDPIVRRKGGADPSTVLELLRRLKRGQNVCLFAEGNRSFSGVTGPIHPATGKLVKMARVPLVTFRFQGGYLAQPRWGKSLRRGRISGETVRVYSPEELLAMSPQQSLSAVNADLYEDAYARQEALRTPLRYRGKRLAEGIEAGFYLCPCCGRAQHIHSEGDRFRCDCGMEGRYLETGFLESRSLPFSTLRDWDEWQRENLPALLSLPDALARDENACLWRVEKDDGRSVVAAGELALYPNRLVIGESELALEQINDIAVCGRTLLSFIASDGTAYELGGKALPSGRIYHDLIHLLKAERDASPER